MSTRRDDDTPLHGVDVLLTDLDGVVYRGKTPVDHAVESLNRAAESIQIGYVTNNAARTDASVAAHLSTLGLTVRPRDVVTSPQAAVRLLGETVPHGATVFVVGGDGLVDELEKAGYRPTRSARDDPAAVVQGFSPDIGWRDLAEASFALQSDRDAAGPIPWIATNTDWTLPVDRGIAPGNGTLVSAVHSAVGRLPVFAGKPERPIFEIAAERFEAHSPLFLGDRLETDIAGAHRAGMPSALVLTGVDGMKQLLAASTEERPDYILGDLRDLFEPYPGIRWKKGHARCGTAEAYLDNGTLVVGTRGTGLDRLRAAVSAVWSSGVAVYALNIPDAVLRLPDTA
jgi:HAD superfamily hydrolase (TIGR01450 family)